MLDDLYLEKPEHYLDHAVWEIIYEIPQGRHRVLDLGCGGGLTGSILKKNGQAAEVMGIEMSSRAAESAKDKLDKVIIGNLEQMDFSFIKGHFDYIILADVLEHLIDPWKLLSKIGKLINPTGKIIATIPNVRHWKVLLPLLIRGQWQYESFGLLDETHLRFFTKKTMRALFDKSGLMVYKIKEMMGNNYKNIYIKNTKAALIDTISFGLFRDFLTPEYLIISGIKP